MKNCLLLVVLVVVSFGNAQSKSKPITELSQKDANHGILVDVRTPQEFAEGHLDQAININWFDEDFAEQFTSLDKEKTIYLYCKKGGRSAKATEMLRALGYKAVNLLGGYDAWEKK